MAGSRCAVIVGVNEYQDKDNIVPLHGAVNDAEHLAERLMKYGDFEQKNVRVLTGPGATCKNIREGMSDLFWADGGSELSLFYFAGHGFQDGFGKSYIAPQDMEYARPLVAGIRMQELRDLVIDAKKEKANIVLILDCCYGRIVVEGERASRALATGDNPVQQSFSSLNDNKLDNGRFILACSGQDDKSRERKDFCHEFGEPPVGPHDPHDHGVFTFNLLEGLDGKCISEDGRVTLAGMQAYLGKSKDYEFDFFNAGSWLPDKIVIIPFPVENIEAIFVGIESLLSKNTCYDTFRAISKLKVLPERARRLKRFVDVKETVNQTLKSYSQSANDWVGTNTGQMVNDNYDEQLERLRKFVADFNFESIAQYDERTTGSLIAFWGVALGQGGNYESLMRQMASASQRPPSPPSGRPSLVGSAGLRSNVPQG